MSNSGSDSVKPIQFVCPICKGALQEQPNAYFCPRDNWSYPVNLGIADFRVFDGSGGSYQEEDYKTRRISAEYSQRTFVELIELYYDISPEVPAKLAKRYLFHTSSGVARAQSALADIRRQSWSRGGETFLEIGCGNGGFLVAAAKEYRQVIGLDIDMCWLVLAKKQLEEAGQDAALICACAEHLPFPESSFDLVVGRDVIEHVAEPTEVMREAYRVLASGGALFLATPNRWSLGLEPHVRVWGVGFLPKSWRDSYVHTVRKIPYGQINTLTYFDIRRLLAQAGFDKWEVSLPSFPYEHIAGMSAWERVVVPIYHRLKDIPPIRQLTYMFGPLFHIVCTKAIISQ